jgi:hypothetical protein
VDRPPRGMPYEGFDCINESSSRVNKTAKAARNKASHDCCAELWLPGERGYTRVDTPTQMGDATHGASAAGVLLNPNLNPNP